MRTATRASALLLPLLFLLTAACAPNWSERYAQVRETGGIEDYRRFVREARDPRLVQQARNELARMELEALPEPRRAQDLRALLQQYGDTEAAPEIRQAMIEADFREQVLDLANEPARMSAALDRWAAENPEDARRLDATQKLNDAIIARIRAERPTGARLMDYIGLLRRPTTLERRLAIETALERLLVREPTTREFLNALREKLPAWVSADLSRKLMASHTERYEQKLLTEAVLPEEIRALLESLGEEAFGQRGSALRRRYDEMLVERLEAGPHTVAAARDYLADRYAQQRRAALESELAALKGEISSHAAERLLELLGRTPPPFLTEQLERRRDRVLELLRLEQERDRLLALFNLPKVDEFRAQRSRMNREAPAMESIRRNRGEMAWLENSYVTIEANGRHTTGVLVTRSGIIVALDYEIAKAPPDTVQLRLADMKTLEALQIGADATTGLLLLRIPDMTNPLVRSLQPARLENGVYVMYDQGNQIRFNTGAIGGFSQGANVVDKGNELPGSERNQTFTIEPETPAPMTGGVVYTIDGEAFALLGKPAPEGNRWYALGLTEATGLIRAYYDRLLKEAAQGDQPELL